jgi:hypothetical protein
MAKITLGPVIGKVTDTTARVLIEVDANVQVTCNAIFRQLITSPITNVPPKLFAFFGLLLLTEAEEKLTGTYSYEHHDFTNKRNYGIILVRVPPNGLPRVDGTLVKET